MLDRQVPIPCALMRGGTSKGAYFLAEDLPQSEAERDALLLSIMGSPDPTQIDGVGGGHPLRSKVAIVRRSREEGIDVDFLFAQVSVERASVDTSPNCGNILAGVGPFAIERNLVQASDGTTRVRVRILNTGSVADLDVETPGGVVAYSGTAEIAGVPGTGSPIRVGFRAVEGSVCGSLLPTGRALDEVEGVPVTCIDNGMPVVVVAARSLGRTGLESVDQLNNDSELKGRLESIRRAAGVLMNLGDVSGRVVPKMSMVAPAANGGCVLTRNFIPKVCHTAIGVFAAVSVASACVLPGSITEGIANVTGEERQLLSVEHPTGEFTVHLDVDRSGAIPRFRSVGLLRTARMLFDGTVFAHRNYRDRIQEEQCPSKLS
jgi:4-oxalomesaconate tautomerase